MSDAFLFTLQQYSLNVTIDTIKVAKGNVYMISELKENIILSELTEQNFDKEYELRIDNILIEKTTYNKTCN